MEISFRGSPLIKKNSCLLDHDLYLEGIECSNEPEFRAYYVLTHLKTTGPQSLLNTRPKVYHSEPVQFALRVYTFPFPVPFLRSNSVFLFKVWEAYTGNDYVGFFNLARRATYLIACLMQPHFFAVRSKAIAVMNKVSF